MPIERPQSGPVEVVYVEGASVPDRGVVVYQADPHDAGAEDEARAAALRQKAKRQDKRRRARRALEREVAKVDARQERNYPAGMSTPGKLELTIKINALPADVTTDKNGWKAFTLDCDGVPVQVRLRPKMWAKIEAAARDWPLWIASITGRMGKRSGEGFAMEEPAVQTFERKPKPEVPQAAHEPTGTG